MEAGRSSTDHTPRKLEVQQQQPSANNKLFMFTTVSILLTAIITGSAVYFLQKSISEKEVTVLKQKVTSLEKEISMRQKEEVSPQPQISPSNSPANWKIYQNKEVTFKYPSQWIEEPILIRGNGFTQEIKDPKGKFSLTFSSTGNYNQVTGKPYASLDEFINMPYQIKTVIIDGQEGKQPLPRAGSENVNSVVFFSKDSKFIYTLELQTGSTAFENVPSEASEADIEEGQRLFDQILTTLKFTE